jgi:hypothetical protein
LRQLVTQIRHGDIQAVLLKQAINPILPFWSKGGSPGHRSVTVLFI